MMVAETDFYIPNPRTKDNQIEYDANNQSTKDFDNPSYIKDDSTDTASAASEKSTSSDSFYSNEHRYGWLCFTPKTIQCLNKPLFFLICLVISGIAQGLVITGVGFTVITSIETQFGLKSTQVALFGTLYDAAYGVCCVFVGYLGHVHKPRWIGFGLLLMAVGAFVTSVPKYIIGTYGAGLSSDNTCHIRTANSTIIKFDCDESSQWYYMFIFMLGNIIMGIGATPLYTLGTAHLDEITHRGQGSLYLGIYYAGAALGPALGFIIGMPILDTWVDITQPAGKKVEPTDPNWVGAWWIGYIVGAIFLLIPVLPLLGFPRVFPDSETIQERKKELEDTVEENKDLKHDVKSVWPATKALLKNPPYLFICLAISAESLAIGGFSTFIPKFVETQFHFTASDSALYTGLIVIPGAAGGIFLGGYLTKRLGWNCKQTLKAASVMAFIATICVASSLIGCKGRDIVGTNDERYFNTTGNIALNSACNAECQCSTKYYKPICSEEDQKTYFTPCHAGCLQDDVTKTFYNCSCLPPNISKVVDGRCTPDCKLFPLFVLGAFLLMFFTFMNNVPMLNATFRVVAEGQGSFAMGFQQVFVRFLGFIPAPTMFGKLIDESCKLWHRDECTGKTTSCLEYNNQNFRYYMFTLGVVTKFLSFVFIFLAYRWYELPITKKEKKSDKKDLYDLTEIASIETPKTSEDHENNTVPSVMV